MKITVTQANIDLGERGNPHHCPIACALEYRFTDMEVVIIPHEPEGYIEVRNPETNEWAYNLTLPSVAVKWAIAFDDGEEVHPFEFETVSI